MDKVYENGLEMIKKEGSTGFVAFGQFIFGVKYDGQYLTFGNVYRYSDFKNGDKSKILIREKSVLCPEEMFNNNFDEIIEKYIEKYLYEPIGIC